MKTKSKLHCSTVAGRLGTAFWWSIPMVIVAVMPPWHVRAQGITEGTTQGAEARALFETGVAQGKRGEWEGAIDSFERSLALVGRPSTHFNLVIALHRAGRVEGVVGQADRFLALPVDQTTTEDRETVARLRDHARMQLGHLRLRLQPDHAGVRIDGATVAGHGSQRDYFRLAGSHMVEVVAPGFQSVLRDLTLAAGRRTDLAIKLLPARVARAARPRAEPRKVSSARTDLASGRPQATQPDSDDGGLLEHPMVWVGAAALVATSAILVGLAASAGTTEHGGTLDHRD